MKKKRIFQFLALGIVVIGFIAASTVNPVWAEIRWFKGNTHTHTTISDSDSSPEAVALWYRDHGYNFLVLTDHNILDDPLALGLHFLETPDYILIKGGEITGRHRESRKPIHTTAQNVEYMPDWTYQGGTKTQVIQFQVDGALNAGGLPILTHPVWLNSLNEYDIFPVQRLHLMEIYNGHVDAYWNYGTEGYPTQEDLWDRLLTMGMKLYGVCADDEHTLTIDFNPNSSGPGYSWVMVNADELTPEAVTEAMARGDFYSSSGVILKTISVERGNFIVEVDREATQRELAYPHMFGSWPHDGPKGYKIEFIGPGGEVLKRSRSHIGVFRVKAEHSYVRAKITFSRAHEGEFEEFYAWTQPIFTDGR